MKIYEKHRRNKYGTKFYHLMLRTTDDRLDSVIVKVKKQDKITISFVKSLKLEQLGTIGNTIFFNDQLIME